MFVQERMVCSPGGRTVMKTVVAVVSGVVCSVFAVDAQQDKPIWQWTPEEMKVHVKTVRSGRDLTPKQWHDGASEDGESLDCWRAKRAKAGKIPPDRWSDIGKAVYSRSENTGYPTQKPLAAPGTDYQGVIEQRGRNPHPLSLVIDGRTVQRNTFTVTTLGQEYVREAPGECVVTDFPSPGESATLRWQEAQQNFVIVE